MYSVQKNCIKIKVKTKSLKVLSKDQETMETSFDNSGSGEFSHCIKTSNLTPQKPLGDEAAILTPSKSSAKVQLFSADTPVLEAGLKTTNSVAGDPQIITWTQALQVGAEFCCQALRNG